MAAQVKEADGLNIEDKRPVWAPGGGLFFCCCFVLHLWGNLFIDRITK